MIDYRAYNEKLREFFEKEMEPFRDLPLHIRLEAYKTTSKYPEYKPHEQSN